MMDKNKIHTMDCLTFLNKVENESIDLAIVDPPYNLKISKWDDFKSQQDFLQFTFQWLDELILKLKKTGSIYIFNTPFNSAFILQHLHNAELVFQNWLIWDKRDGLACAKKKYTNGQETILFFTKTKKYTFNSDDIRVPYESTERIEHAKLKGILKNGKRWFPNPKGKLCSEIWHYSSVRHHNKVNGKVVKMSHLTPKPLKMIERIVRASSNQNDLILDCFMGSGTTALACKNLDRNFLGCDNQKKYVTIANKRLKTARIVER